MRLIKNVSISRFRSIRESSLHEIGDFSVIAGLNNAGKSNFLRAIHTFFEDAVEPAIPISLAKDYFRPALRSKTKKEISISVEFELPEQFKFRRGLEPSKKLLGRHFKITKKWNRDSELPDYHLNESATALSLDDHRHVDSFLKLITLRYIPNRVVPTDVIRLQQESIRDLIVRRLARYRGQTEPVFRRLQETAESLIQPLASQVLGMIQNIDSVRLATASSLEDLALRFGYSVLENGSEMEGDEQGSGLQSLLMFQTLHLIDLDFFQQFGWKQASIWLVEEPESSLHVSLEAHVGEFLARISSMKDGRLQTIATTHSDIMIQYSDAGYLVSRRRDGRSGQTNSSSAEKHDVRELLNLSARTGISRWVNPILLNPLDSVFVVEGKHDRDFLKRGLEIRGKTTRPYHIVTIGDLLGTGDEGGIDKVKQYIRENADAIETRASNAPVVVILDWEEVGKLKSFQDLVKNSRSYHVLIWDESKCNPKLHSSFRGIERFYSDKIIAEGEKRRPNVILTDNSGEKSFMPDKSKDQMKSELHKIVTQSVDRKDLIYAEHILETMESLIEGDG